MNQAQTEKTEHLSSGPHRGSRSDFLQRPLARGLSFLLAIVMSVVILIYPNAIATSATDINHGMLSLLMWGIAAGFVHGVGYVPLHRIWRILLGAWIAWPVLLAGIYYVLFIGLSR